jgi:CheY-like chemotaxis protein
VRYNRAMRTDGRTALGAARARFLAELGQRAQELRGATAQLAAVPGSPRARQELWRRLHTLHASAQLCELPALAGALGLALQQLEDSAATGVAPVAALNALADALPGLAAGSGAVPALLQAPAAASAPTPLVTPTAGRPEMQLTQTVSGLRSPGAVPGPGALVSRADATVDDIATRLAEEIRRGIADSLQAGRDERIAVGDDAELKAAAWSAIDRVRSHLAERSAGRVRFIDAPQASPRPAANQAEGPRPAANQADSARPATNQTAPAAPELPPELQPERLRGRTLLVADDDPVVLAFFAGLLRDAGARVLEAKNGREALGLARAERPELLLSDILMPKIDGFALCRELKRDLVLAHVPVVLSSWKEDYLQRMRELDAGASGYLRKESGAAQVLRTVLEALAPRLRLELAIDSAGAAQGRVEDTGILALVETAAARLGTARLWVRDSWNVFEVQLEAGQRIAVTRTASDGSFARGDSALLQLVGVAAGSFELRAEPVALRGQGDGPVSQVLLAAAARLAAIMDAVSDARLLQVATVTFDDEVLPGLLEITPTHVAYLVQQLRSGEMSASELLATGQFPARELETQLLELARRGAIAGVRGKHGEDRVQEALFARRADSGRLLHASLPPAPPAPDAERLTPDPPSRLFWAQQPDALARAVVSAPVRSDALQPAALDAELDAVLSEPPPAPPRALPRPVVRDQVDPPRARGPALSARRSALAGATRPVVPASRGVLGLVLSLLVLMGAGYYGWLTLYLRAPLPDAFGTTLHSSAAAAAEPESEPEPAPAPAPALAPAPAPAAVAVSEDADPGYGRALPFVDRSRGVEVAADEGLLVVELDGRGSSPQLRVDSRPLGRAPIAVALPAGRHEIVIDRAGSLSYRYLVIRPGETRVVELSTEP